MGMIMEQWDSQEKFSREWEFYLQVEKHTPVKVAEVSLHWDPGSFCSITPLSTIYFYTHIRVG